MTDVHYHFEGDDVYAIHEGRVIASGKADKMDEVESDATNYLKGLKNEKD
jgi:Fe-S cluster assembly ATPase SufC